MKTIEALIHEKAMLKKKEEKDLWGLRRKINAVFPLGLRLLYMKTITQKKPSLLEVQRVDEDSMIVCRYIGTPARSIIRLSVEKIAEAEIIC